MNTQLQFRPSPHFFLEQRLLFEKPSNTENSAHSENAPSQDTSKSLDKSNKYYINFLRPKLPSINDCINTTRLALSVLFHTSIGVVGNVSFGTLKSIYQLMKHEKVAPLSNIVPVRATIDSSVNVANSVINIPKFALMNSLALSERILNLASLPLRATAKGAKYVFEKWDKTIDFIANNPAKSIATLGTVVSIAMTGGITQLPANIVWLIGLIARVLL